MTTKNNSKNKGSARTLQVTSIGDLTRQLLVMPINPDAPKDEQVRLSNEEIAQRVTEAYPNRKANGAAQCVAWYASKLRKDSDYREKYTNGRMPLPARGSSAPKTVEVTLD